jgi:hypothetical protein
VGESKSDDYGGERALSSTENLAHVDGDLAVRGPGRHNGAVAGWISEARTRVSIVERQNEVVGLTQIPMSKQKRLFRG